MKKIFSLMILSLMVISILGVVSATPVPSGTNIVGTIYDANDVTLLIEDASVTVYCVHDAVTSTGTATSDEFGFYSVLFSVDECDMGDSLTVTATKGSLSGSNTGIVDQNVSTWNIGIVDVPMVPEFGVVVGFLTMISAIGVFFVIRKK